MNKIIRLTESDLHNIIKIAVGKILKEDSGLGGATSCAGVFDTSNSKGEYEGGDAQKKQVTAFGAFGGPIKQANNLGKKNDKFFGETTGRHNGEGGSISVNRYKGKKS